MVDELLRFGESNRLSSEITDDGPDDDGQSDLIEPDIQDPPADFLAYGHVLVEAGEQVDGQIDERKT